MFLNSSTQKYFTDQWFISREHAAKFWEIKSDFFLLYLQQTCDICITAKKMLDEACKILASKA